MDDNQELNNLHQPLTSSDLRAASSDPTPEPQKPKQGITKKTLALSIILTLLLTACITSVIWFFITNNNKPSNSSTSSTNCPTETEKQETVSASDTKTVEIVEATKPSYADFVEKMLSEQNLKAYGSYYEYNGSENVLVPVNAYLRNGHLKIVVENSSQKVLAESDGILAVFFVQVGNGGVPYYYMINEDGTVSRINISRGESSVIEQIEGFSNIVSIFNGGDLKVQLYDIDGNHYEHY